MNMRSLNEHTILAKTLIALLASLISALLGMFFVCFLDRLDVIDLGENYETSLVTNILGTTFIVVFYLILFAIIAIGIYNLLLRKLAQKSSSQQTQIESPLTDAAKGHEQQIIDLMISVIQPIPGKDTITIAKAAKFIKALKDLNLMDVNLEGQHLIPWIETVTGFAAGKTSPFNQALKAVKVDDDDVPKYKAQLEQIIAS